MSKTSYLCNECSNFLEAVMDSTHDGERVIMFRPCVLCSNNKVEEGIKKGLDQAKQAIDDLDW